MLQDLKASEGFELSEFAVPPPGLDVNAQALDIAQRTRADFVLMHLFGRAPSIALKALKGNGYPLRKVLGFVWASAEADIEAQLIGALRAHGDCYGVPHAPGL